MGAGQRSWAPEARRCGRVGPLVLSGEVGWLDESVARKLPDAELRAFAANRSDDVVSVLIEVDQPSPRVTLTQGSRRQRPRITAPQPAAGNRWDEAARFLGEILGSQPRWLSAAGAFVADVTGAQLAEIARSPLTRSVARNRNLPPPRV
jgi:hypothetical protein